MQVLEKIVPIKGYEGLYEIGCNGTIVSLPRNIIGHINHVSKLGYLQPNKYNKAYLDWLWIDNIEKNQNAVFYIPTENKLPLMLSDRKSNNATAK